MKTSHTRILFLAAIVAATVGAVEFLDREPPSHAGGKLEIGVVRTSWIGSGIRMREHAYLQSANETAGRIWIAEIDPPKARVSIVPSPEPEPLHTVLAGTRGDFVAINGGFYDLGKAMGLVVAAGEIVNPFARGGGSGIFWVGSAGVGITHRDTYRPAGVRNALQSIDRLAAEGAILLKDRDGLPRDARSVVGLKADGTVVLVTMVDERAIGSAKNGRVTLNRKSTTTGPTLAELAEVLVRAEDEGGLGIVNALNLDGGYSTAFHAKIGGREVSVAGYRGTINAVRAVPSGTPLPTM